MKISDFKINGIYKREQLIDAFGGSFMRGMNICNKTKTLVLISKHMSNRIYEDSFGFHNDILYYTGEGRNGDQTLNSSGNKKLYFSNRDNTPVYLFVVYKKKEYKYFGQVKFVGDISWSNENDVDGNLRKVIKFPLSRINNGAWLLDNKSIETIITGAAPSIKKTVRVVGAAILNNEKLVCAQRSGGELDGCWEFPGGKIEIGESPVEAIKREIKEELDIDIEVCDFLDRSTFDNGKQIIELSVYKCKKIHGEIKPTVHKKVIEFPIKEIDELNWAEADRPIVDALLDQFPSNIVDVIDYDYFETEKITSKRKEIDRKAEDYEKSQRAKKRAGDKGQEAVLRFERDKLNNAGRPDLADLVKDVSSNNTLGYDIFSYEVIDNVEKELHIEVKVSSIVGDYLEFFISGPELKKFKENYNHVIYCLVRNGKNYNLHCIKRDDFLIKADFDVVSYRVKIKISN